MTDNNKYDITDLVVSAIEQKPLDFEAAFNDLIVDRLHTAIENKKIEVAQQMYGYQPEEEYYDSETEEEYESEEEIDDEES
jgi:hypothetical protein